jgi:hypothetical protein
MDEMLLNGAVVDTNKNNILEPVQVGQSYGEGSPLQRGVRSVDEVAVAFPFTVVSCPVCSAAAGAGADMT